MKFGGRISLTLSVTRPPLLRRRAGLEPASAQFLKLRQIEVPVLPEAVGADGSSGANQTNCDYECNQCDDEESHRSSPSFLQRSPSTAAAIRWCPIVAAQAAEPGREISMKFCGSFSDLCRPTAHIDRLGARTGPATAWRCGSRLTTLYELQTHVRSRATYSERNGCWRGTPVGVSSAHI